MHVDQLNTVGDIGFMLCGIVTEEEIISSSYLHIPKPLLKEKLLFIITCKTCVLIWKVKIVTNPRKFYWTEG
jgi:hypothetical protein